MVKRGKSKVGRYIMPHLEAEADTRGIHYNKIFAKEAATLEKL